MKKKYKIVLLFLTALFINSNYAALNNNSAATVIISFEEEFLSKSDLTLEVSVFSYYHVKAVDLYDEKYRRSVDKQDVTIGIPLRSDISLVKIEVFDNGESLVGLFPTRVYLVEPGDSLSFRVGDKIFLEGVDNEKNRIRERLSSVAKSMTANWLGYYIKQENIHRYYAVRNDLYNAIVERKLELLEKNRDKVSDRAYAYIKEECIYTTESKRITTLQGGVETGAPYQGILKKYVFQEYQNTMKERTGSSGESYAYTNYIIDLLTAGYLIQEYVKNPSSAPTVDLNIIIDDLAKMNLEQENGDKIIAFLFSRFATAAKGGEQAIEKALDFVRDSRIKSYLLDVKEKRYTNSDVYPFRLEDVDGNIYTPESFKGKKVVLDFWFNGCTGCALLHKELEKIEKNLNDSSVLFISVNVDAKRDKWLQGIASGKYTSEGGINLRIIDPKPNIASYYGFFSFPQLLMIDGKGSLVSYNPPRPINVSGRKEFVEMLIRMKN
ncbi:TlpA family protein disulfide reductase [Sphingobacterium chuzhouense]|uniref:TlpA family protein disulfide reductase n=1 Tax=Sphingobacterium chuzhouense TaxID=1742264 RepID=A0ABR7XTU6_9SPHI|nr:TlpA disulfide reductase family protein [Sphingobacterium chuzhouense]MBD1422571.1 TlpA family protein disulfide reductase [Sphingobacterium chuzhouense]